MLSTPPEALTTVGPAEPRRRDRGLKAAWLLTPDDRYRAGIRPIGAAAGSQRPLTLDSLPGHLFNRGGRYVWAENEPQRDFQHFVAPVPDALGGGLRFDISDDPDALRGFLIRIEHTDS